jgi:hypothetical protein
LPPNPERLASVLYGHHQWLHRFLLFGAEGRDCVPLTPVMVDESTNAVNNDIDANSGGRNA